MRKLPRKAMIVDMLQKEPEDVFLNYALAMEYLGVDNLAAAIHQFEKTLQIDPNYLPCFYQLGQVNEKLDDPDKALDYYKQGADLARSQNNHKALGELQRAIWMLEDE